VYYGWKILSGRSEKLQEAKFQKKITMADTTSYIDSELKKYEGKNFDSLIQQIDAEYNISWLHQFDKIQQNLGRLKLYNNQKRDPDAIGDPLLFTVHQTLLASLYDDSLSVTFEGREEGDNDTADNLNSLATFDYEKMGKDVVDYMWDWDTLFFGRGLVMLQEFDRNKDFMCPIPENWDPMTFLRDPKAVSVNGDVKGRGGMRFGGRELWLNRMNLTRKNGYFDTKYLRATNEIKDLLQTAERERDSAQNLQALFNKDMESNMGDNSMIGGLQWFTYWKGKRVMVVLAQNKTKIIKYRELTNQRRYPLIDRPMYPHSHDWAGTSIPDLIEDKQRQRSVAINLGLQAMKADLYPMYLYDEDRIKNKGDLLKFAFNKFIGVTGGDGKDIRGAAQPLNKPSIAWNMVDFIINTLDVSAQRATATPEMQQGQLSQNKRTATELNLVSAKVDTRYSLSAKVFGWSERDFWRTWYSLYKEHFNDGIDAKVIRISGSFGSEWRKLTRENIISPVDPDVFIESKTISDAKRIRERLLLQQFGTVVFADQEANKRYFEKKLARLNGFKKDEVDILFPPTSEELRARDENKTLDDNKLTIVHPLDDHNVHLMEHRKSAETAAKAAHIAAHIEGMTSQRRQPELYPQLAQPLSEVTPSAKEVAPPAGVMEKAMGVFPGQIISEPTG